MGWLARCNDRVSRCCANRRQVEHHRRWDSLSRHANGSCSPFDDIQPRSCAGRQWFEHHTSRRFIFKCRAVHIASGNYANFGHQKQRRILSSCRLFSLQRCPLHFLKFCHSPHAPSHPKQTPLPVSAPWRRVEEYLCACLNLLCLPPCRDCSRPAAAPRVFLHRSPSCRTNVSERSDV